MAKSLLQRKNIPYLENVIGEDITREELLATYPEVKSLPLIIVNSVKIGGYDQLVEWVKKQPQLLTEG
jgi:glutaredoxin